MLCQRVPQESATAAQRAGRGHHRGTLTPLSLPPFLPPCPCFLTASFTGSHGTCHVCTGQVDDCQIESNQKMLLIYLFLLPSLYQTRYFYKKKIAFLPIWPQAIKPARQLKIKTPKPYRFVRNTVLWPISQNILITVFNSLYNLLLSSNHENPCIAAKDFLDKSVSGRMPWSKSA